MRHLPPLHISPDAINARLASLAKSRKCKKCKKRAIRAAADITALLSEVSRLHAALAAARLDAANLRAAIQSALGAAEDGEADPLAYLRDEFPGPDGGWCL
ncbi:MAG TPA: hypothetical protein VGM53_31030 [Streptosporangiaceae bacterium]|jgi:hypothetical protein